MAYEEHRQAISQGESWFMQLRDGKANLVVAGDVVLDQPCQAAQATTTSTTSTTSTTTTSTSSSDSQAVIITSDHLKQALYCVQQRHTRMRAVVVADPKHDQSYLVHTAPSAYVSPHALMIESAATAQEARVAFDRMEHRLLHLEFDFFSNLSPTAVGLVRCEEDNTYRIAVAASHLLTDLRGLVQVTKELVFHLGAALTQSMAPTSPPPSSLPANVRDQALDADGDGDGDAAADAAAAAEDEDYDEDEDDGGDGTEGQDAAASANTESKGEEPNRVVAAVQETLPLRDELSRYPPPRMIDLAPPGKVGWLNFLFKGGASFMKKMSAFDKYNRALRWPLAPLPSQEQQGQQQQQQQQDQELQQRLQQQQQQQLLREDGSAVEVCTVVRRTFDAAAVTALQEAARAHGATVNGMLSVALALAQREQLVRHAGLLVEASRVADGGAVTIPVTTTADARRSFNLPAELVGNLSEAVTTGVPVALEAGRSVAPSRLWAAARAFAQDVQAGLRDKDVACTMWLFERMPQSFVGAAVRMASEDSPAPLTTGNVGRVGALPSLGCSLTSMRCSFHHMVQGVYACTVTYGGAMTVSLCGSRLHGATLEAAADDLVRTITAVSAAGHTSTGGADVGVANEGEGEGGGEEDEEKGKKEKGEGEEEKGEGEEEKGEEGEGEEEEGEEGEGEEEEGEE